jgi:hypothetical protein
VRFVDPVIEIRCCSGQFVVVLDKSVNPTPAGNELVLWVMIHASGPLVGFSQFGLLATSVQKVAMS